MRVVRNAEPPVDDLVAVEEPLEMRVDGRPLAVTMRTPGDDEDLVAGFFYSESVIDGGEQIASISIPEDVGDGDLVGLGSRSPRDSAPRRIDVTLRDGLDEERFEHAHREFRAVAACGICGKQKLEDLCQELPPIERIECDVSLLQTLPDVMRPGQVLFDSTGGIHAAGLFSPDGELLCLREDVGRHNAVDKVIGHFVRRCEMPLAGSVLVVSGRAGFELVQKALRAAVPVMVAVGAASSLAVDLATHGGMDLHSFVRPGRSNLHV